MDNGIKADIFFISAALLILANVYLWQFVFSLGSNLKVVFFDVGEGDGIFIETPQGHQILIDGGPGGQILGKLQKQMPFWDRTVDLAILTHPEYDHLAGLNAVLQHYKAQNILWTGVVKDTAVVREWLGLLRKEGASVFIVRDGQTIKAGTVEGSVLWPTESFVDAFSGNDVNNTAIVLKMDYIKNSFLFSGDIEQKIEKELVGYYGDGLRVNVLKTAHHGSKTSSSADFLANVQPQWAVVTCGRNNKYGHPSKETLKNLARFAINVLRTDLSTDIKMVGDGQTIQIKNKNQSI